MRWWHTCKLLQHKCSTWLNFYRQVTAKWCNKPSTIFFLTHRYPQTHFKSKVNLYKTCSSSKIEKILNFYTIQLDSINSKSQGERKMVRINRVKISSMALQEEWIPHLPVYNAHPYFEACFQKNSVSMSFLLKNNFLEKFSRNVKSSSTCMKISYRSFMMFSLFSSAVLLQHDQMWPFAQCL